MDGDDIAYPHRLQCQVEHLAAHGNVDLLGGWMVVFRSDGTPIGTRRGPLSHAEICAHPWSGFTLPHPTWMGKREWFLRNPYCTAARNTQDQELLLRTHRSSRFATVPEIVMGYREDGLSLAKILPVRLEMCTQMIRNGRDPRMLAIGAAGVAGLLAKGAMDTIAIGTGLGYRLLRHRAPAMEEAEASEWRSVWGQIELTRKGLFAEGKSSSYEPQSAEV
jgi:hypothetical protein